MDNHGFHDAFVVNLKKIYIKESTKEKDKVKL